ncbi:peptidase G2 autoproteolytic cleavage domain-containing protein [Pseudodonghicola flavimaris]|uniref:Peptidase G2 autoproteolytic cleavage domain-containing protein n=1 Tax=Pseudodonghicola flavimaris TaxID=3050036 RepID=A0ABT7F810_9RHOB|nr:peptidase G2 autoproteolytic cleavage domain-containing protein [Pseudodonghicola flavimaris]MDK3020764.1 peptidase G2 autoproteolytic cleavage domain-containing protein [Pseudodonghicola flavimaris]
MAIPSLTALTNPPARASAPANYVSSMDSWLASLVTLVTEFNTLVSYLNTNSTIIGSALNGTSIGLTTPAASKFTQVIVEQPTTGTAMILRSDSGYNVALKFSPQSTDVWSIIGTQAGSLSFYDFGGPAVPVIFETGAEANTFVLDAASRVGVGTASPTAKLGVSQAAAATSALAINCTSTSFTSLAANISVSTSAASTFSFLTAYSGGGDLEFKVRGDGEVTADGSFNGGGADYAEYFEWEDGNPGAADRRGVSVVLVNEKIRPALAGETPIGVISGRPSVVGDSDIDRWKDKYLTDDFGSHVLEDHDAIEWTEIEDQGTPELPNMVEIHHAYVVGELPPGVTPPPEAVTTTIKRKVLNPSYDPALAYVPRADRPEWDAVGLMGKLRILKGQPVAPGWMKMRDISATVEEWLVK